MDGIKLQQQLERNLQKLLGTKERKGSKKWQEGQLQQASNMKERFLKIKKIEF